MTERVTDDFIFSLLRAANIKYVPDGSNLLEIKEALLSASKAGTGKSGRPEFTAQVGDFIIIGEDKKLLSLQAKYLDDGQSMLDESPEAIRNYAENGALHYARHIVSRTNFKKVFAFGCSGDEKHYKVRPIFVSEDGTYKVLKEVDNFENFNVENIDRYYHEQVLGEEPKEVKELKDILSRAKRLHEDLRNYANLGETEKPLVVSAILLALNEDSNIVERLTGDKVTTDGQKIFNAVDAHMRRVRVEPEVKREKVINQFNIIKDRDVLSVLNQNLGKTPLRYFTEYLKSYVIEYTKNNSPEDVLGRFYGEFMSYSGGDGQSLGVVLTPRHITEIFCDLVSLKPSDRLFDPCCGTGGFLIAGMHHMLERAKGEEQKLSVKKQQIYGIEIREDMFSVATTNMILRGDGKSNLTPGDFLAQDALALRAKEFTVGFMNPPYSQAKNKETAHLSEINFISHLLNSMADDARVVVIVPQSTMVGKTNEDKVVKTDILKHHTLEGVITLNKNTFYRVGTNACIAVFTAHQPHPKNLYAKFINFEDDGFEVNKHIGLIETERAKEKRQHLLDCWLHNKDADSKFMVKAKVEPHDEWLHSFYYFNDELPVVADFEKTMTDYLTFEFKMIACGREDLFSLSDDDGDGQINQSISYSRSKYTINSSESDGPAWREFSIKDIFDIKPGKRLVKAAMSPGLRPFIGASDSNNGITEFVSNENASMDRGVLGVNYNGSVVENFYHPYECIFSDDVKRFSVKDRRGNKYIYLFLKTVILKQKEKYQYGYKFNEARMRQQKILLPVTGEGEPHYEYMEGYIRKIETDQMERYSRFVRRAAE